MNTDTGVKALDTGPRRGVCAGCGDKGWVSWQAKDVGVVCRECANLQIAAELEKAVASIEVGKAYRRHVLKMEAGKAMRKLKGFMGLDGEEVEGGEK